MLADTVDAPYEALVAFLYQTPIGVLELEGDGTVCMANPMAVQLLLPVAAGAGLDNLFDALQPRLPGLRDEAGRLPPDPAHPGLERRLPGGSPGSTLALRLARVAPGRFMASVTDVTRSEEQEQQRMAARVHDVQRTDALTALPNRQALLELLKHHLDAPGRPRPALLLVNLDRFERVNTRLGVAVGDQVLRDRALRLGASLRALVGSAGFAARLGGDELAVLLDEPSAGADAEQVAMHLLQALGAPCQVAGQRVEIGVSIGVLPGAHMGHDAEAALHDAALAMRQAKRQGGGRLAVFHPATREQALAAARLEHELRLALQEGQLFVVYQPIVPMAADAVLGVEALVRWQHPQHGLVPPDRFIGIAEASGLIVPLGGFVLREACRQFARWQRTLGDRAPRKLSVNVSRAQLQSPEVEADLDDALRDSGIAPQALQLEVTESLAAQHAELQAVLHRLKARGIRIALDDFGTGFSSLSSLHQLPVDVVKIDRSFVRLLAESPHHRVLVEATLMVARSLGMDTVAEGVETVEQAEVLARLRCGSAQGYLHARPQTAAQLEPWLLARP